MASFDSVNSNRAMHWYRNALKYQFAKKLPNKRDAHLWIFSAWEGQKYSDNAQYLFEYVRKKHSEIKCVWQTKNEQVFDDLQKVNIPVQMIGSPESDEIQRQAGVAVFTNGIDDFGYSGNVFGAKLVCLWHGFGLKQGYRQLYRQNNPLKRIISNIKWDTFSWVSRDITIVVSEYTKRQYAQMFRIKDDRTILIAGQARYDAFFDGKRIEDVIVNKEIIDKLKGKKIVLYMPTFRVDSKSMIEQIEELYRSEQLQRVLENNNAMFISKLHYLNRGNIQENEKCILLNDDDVKDTQILLSLADVLITDYSSCAIDFSLLDRPEIFFFPDWSEKKRDQSIIPEIEQICSENKAFSANELIDTLAETLEFPGKSLAQSKKVREYFCQTKVDVGNYAENNYKMIVDALYELFNISI